MARINLLPWRETERKRRLREFIVMAVTALAATLIGGVALHLHVEGLISGQEGRNRFLQNEIHLLDEKIKEIQELEKTKANLLARMEIIQQLQKSRPAVVHLFDELAVRIPEGVYLTTMSQTDRSVVVEGRAQSNARVSSFMRNIEASKWVGKPLLMLIENKDQTGTGMSHFRLRFEQLSQEGDESIEKI